MRAVILVAACSALITSATFAGDSRFSAPDITEQSLSSLKVEQFSDVVDAFVAKGQYAKALEAVDVGLRKNPKSVQLKFQRCVVLEQMGNYEGAQKELERLKRTYPEIPEIYNNLAVLQSRNGDLNNAEENLKRALAIRPKFRQAYVNLGNLYLARAKTAYASAQAIRNDKSVKARLDTVSDLLSHP